MLQIIKNRRCFFTASSVVVGFCVAAILVWGLKPGIDFTGGSFAEYQFDGNRPEKVEIENILQVVSVVGSTVQPLGDSGYVIRMPFIEEERHDALLANMREQYGESFHEERFDMVGPSISAELKEKTFYAIIFVVVAIIFYIAWAFRSVSEPVRSWKFGVCAVIALIHDVIIPAGVFAVLGRFVGMEVDIMFVTALLTILGFSVNDTIVTFDRVRENLLKRRHDSFEEIVNDSVNQTISRSINTSATTLLALFAVYFFGGGTMRPFMLTLIIGVIVGTYSSIFLASPLLVEWYKRGK